MGGLWFLFLQSSIMFESGQILKERYQLRNCLGEHPGCETWLALDLQVNELVVVKLLLFGGPMLWQDICLFEREVEVLAQLDHPYIPAYYDHFSLDDRTPTYLGLVQAYIVGESLQDCLARGHHFQEKDLQEIADRVLEILIYLHKHQPSILHRDIKPSNLMRGAEGCIHLIDFGSVQTANASPGRSFTVVGTYGYTPMEQFGGRTVPASDLYALGCTLVHLATGRSPADLIQEDGRINVVTNTTLSLRFAQWLQRLCEPHVGHRPRSASEAREHLSASQLTSPVEIEVREPPTEVIQVIPQLTTPLELYTKPCCIIGASHSPSSDWHTYLTTYKANIAAKKNITAHSWGIWQTIKLMPHLGLIIALAPLIFLSPFFVYWLFVQYPWIAIPLLFICLIKEKNSAPKYSNQTVNKNKRF